MQAENVVQSQTNIQIVDGDVVTDTDRAARRLHVRVKTRLDGEVGRLRLERPGRIPVRWSRSGRPVQPPARALGIEGHPLDGDVRAVPEFLRSLPRRQLMVLGAPGSGKSVLALLLAKDLLAAWQPDEPVPVLMALSSWRPTVGLRDWMIQHVRESGGADLAQALFDEHRVMPVLDGLDELPAPLHSLAVEAIDTAVADGLPLLVTCRAHEYEQAVRNSGQYLTRAAVVELEKVGTADAVGYLQESTLAGDTRWDPVHEALRNRPDTALATVLSSPLMLYLVLTAYRGRSTDPAELLDGARFPTPEAIESHLLTRYLPAAFGPLSDARFDAEQAELYLTTIARQMNRDETHEFAWWQIHSPVTAAAVGLAFACSYGWFLSLLIGPVLGLASGLVTGGAGFFVHMAVREKRIQVHVTEDVLHGPRGVLRRYAVLAWLSALLVGTLMGAAVGGWLSMVLDVPSRPLLSFSLFVGGAAGLAALFGSTWGSYLVSRIWLSLTGRLPWRFWTFVDTAHALGVLRQTGAVHQFRHLRVQEQLSGGRKPVRRSVYSRASAARRWKLLLPVLPVAAQTLVALAWLVLAGALSAGNGIGENLRYRSGDEPVREYEFCETACTSTETWTWRLPPGGARRTVTTPDRPSGTAVAQWGGSVAAHGCPGAAVEVTLRPGDHPSVSFVLRAGAGVDALRDVARLPEPVHLEGAPVTITLRRTDAESCETRFSWTGPGLVKDGMEPVRKYFGLD
ncbi:NACHT domain-containing protein [Streptomyces antimicrobicus]|uniref:NACHT domain-containing protein n=1 Tax=Streptomyces antimicrobicus TaxID=2883108 RepID=A0ABS8B166_9ACTN|nr:NACHT domain-containing protein [Streptomyces antimicrobicus]MCB5178307.1 NACHT domain-containing protein [Streptomyces antimicrobicus]